MYFKCILINDEDMVLLKEFCILSGCWQEAAGGPTGWVLDPPLSMWEWLGWYSEASLWAGLDSEKFMSILETKRMDSNASEYDLNHCHMEKGGSKYQPRPRQAALFQHIVLTVQWFQSLFRCTIATLNFSMGFNIIALYMDCVTHK